LVGARDNLEGNVVFGCHYSTQHRFCHQARSAYAQADDE
jgi:hypothetical protein